MWFFRWLLLAIVFVALLFFGFQNAGHVVTGLRFGTIHLPQTPLLLVILASFLLGLVVMFIISSVEYFRLSARLRAVTKERDGLSGRISSLQRIPLDQIDEALEGSPGEPMDTGEKV